MRVLRALAGALLWIVASVLGLVAVLLCVTVILLPLGIPLLLWTGRLFGKAMRLFMPRTAAHPVRESAKSTKDALGKARDGVSDSVSGLGGFDAGKARKRLRKKWRKVVNA